MTHGQVNRMIRLLRFSIRSSPTRDCLIGHDSYGPRFFLCRVKLVWDMVAGAKVHLIGRLTTEGGVWELGVMGVDVETDQASDRLWAVQGIRDRGTQTFD
jgi:hypothetical protein